MKRLKVLYILIAILITATMVSASETKISIDERSTVSSFLAEIIVKEKLNCICLYYADKNKEHKTVLNNISRAAHQALSDSQSVVFVDDKNTDATQIKLKYIDKPRSVIFDVTIDRKGKEADCKYAIKIKRSKRGSEVVLLKGSKVLNRKVLK